MIEPLQVRSYACPWLGANSFIRRPVDFQQVCRRGVAVRALALDPTGRGWWLARKRATSDPMNRGFAIRERTRVQR
jgi:hypothetical protein